MQLSKAFHEQVWKEASSEIHFWIGKLWKMKLTKLHLRKYPFASATQWFHCVSANLHDWVTNAATVLPHPESSGHMLSNFVNDSLTAFRICSSKGLFFLSKNKRCGIFKILIIAWFYIHNLFSNWKDLPWTNIPECGSEVGGSLTGKGGGPGIPATNKQRISTNLDVEGNSSHEEENHMGLKMNPYQHHEMLLGFLTRVWGPVTQAEPLWPSPPSCSLPCPSCIPHHQSQHSMQSIKSWRYLMEKHTENTQIWLNMYNYTTNKMIKSWQKTPASSPPLHSWLKNMKTVIFHYIYHDTLPSFPNYLTTVHILIL